MTLGERKKKRMGLWCGWVLYALFYVIAPFWTGINWRYLLLIQGYNSELQSHYLIGGLQVVFAFILMMSTVRSFRHERITLAKYQKIILVAGWIVIIAGCLIFNITLKTHFADWVNVADFAFLTGITVSAILTNCSFDKK